MLLLITVPVLAEGPEKPNVVPGLSLPEPRKVTRPGYAKVLVTLGPIDNKGAAQTKPQEVELAFDVEASFADEDVEFSWEPVVNKDGLTIGVQVAIPDSAGLIRIAAWGTVNGKLLSKRLCKTTIEVDYKPRGTPAAEKPEAKPALAKGKVVDAYFVVDGTKGDANVNALVASQGLKNALWKMGIKRHVFDAGTDEGRGAIARNALEKYVKDAGLPALILVTEARKVRKAIKVPGTQAGIVEVAK